MSDSSHEKKTRKGLPEELNRFRPSISISTVHKDIEVFVSRLVDA